MKKVLETYIGFAIDCDDVESTILSLCINDHVLALWDHDKWENASDFASSFHFCEICDESLPVFNDFGDELDLETSEVIMSACNASILLERLHLNFEKSGCIEPDDLLGRAMLANIGRDDSGVSDSEINGQYAAGLEAGYFETKCSKLVELALNANKIGANIIWGEVY